MITLIDRKLACENTKFNVFFDHIRDDQKNEVLQYLVIETKVRQVDAAAGIAVLPVVDQKFGLLKIFRYPLNVYSFEAPRGFMDEGETLESTAIRELQEETGLVCSKSDLTHITDIAPEPGVILAKIRIYIAKNCTKLTKERSDEIGLNSIEYFSTNEMEMMIRSGKILDPSTIIAFSFWKMYYQ